MHCVNNVDPIVVRWSTGSPKMQTLMLNGTLFSTGQAN